MRAKGEVHRSFDRNSTQALVAAIVLGTVGASTILVMPGLLGAIFAELTVSESQLGFIASVNIFIFAIATGLSALFIGQYDWRLLATVGLIVMIVGNLASIFSSSYEQILWSRGISGFGEGIAVGVSFAALGATRKPDRAFGIYLVSALLFSAVTLYLFPLFVEYFGYASVFIYLILLCVINLGCIPWLTPCSSIHTADFDSNVPIPYKLAIIGFVMVMFFFIAQGAVWSYLERIGAAHDVPMKVIGGALAASALAGVVGAGIATVLCDRYGRLLPITLGLIVQAASMVMLATETTISSFVVAVMMFNFSWNLCQPYYSAIMAELDPAGRVVVLMGSIQTVGVAVGPFIGALLLLSGGLERISYLGLICLAGAFASTVVLLSLWKKSPDRVQSAVSG